MSAETLRRAAELIRQRAEAATNYPWAANEPGTSWRHYDGQVHAVGFPDDFDNSICDVLDNADAQHIASWHPAVALAVADWLDAEAANRDAGIGGRGWFSVGGQTDALAVARAYLGEDA